jgi:hypothetical protein
MTAEPGVQGEHSGECPRCDEPITIYRGNMKRYFRSIGPVIQDAVNHINSHPGSTDRPGVLKYVVADGYYPDEVQNYIDLSEMPEKHRHGATIDAQYELSRRGLMYNSLRFDPLRLHIVPTEWLFDKQPGRLGER